MKTIHLFLILVFMLLARLTFAQDITSPWTDKATGGTEVIFKADHTGTWKKSSPTLNKDDMVEWMQTETDFTYTIDSDNNIALTRTIDGKIFNGKIRHLTKTHLTLILKDGKVPTRYE